jgi:transcriptional regulator with XRE-family HTH domain
MSKEVLLEKLTDTTYRNAFISEEIDTGLPMQLRAMREARGWNQKYVAEKMETKQPRFSLMEKPGYGNFSLNTLKRLASIFNVGLIVSFVPYSEMIEFVAGFSRKRLEIPSFGDEYVTLERRYAKTTRLLTQGSIQEDLNFPAETSAPLNSSTEGLTATSLASHDEAILSLNPSTVLEAEPPYENNAPLAAAQAVGL